MKQVNLAIGNQDMLTDAHLRVKVCGAGLRSQPSVLMLPASPPRQTGVRYGLVGRNGEGKVP